MPQSGGVQGTSPSVIGGPRDPLGGVGGGRAKQLPMAMAVAVATPMKRRKWYLGIQSKKDPAHVMTEVLL